MCIGTERAQTHLLFYSILFYSILFYTYLQALQKSGISKHMQIHEAKHADVANDLFDFAMLERRVLQWMAKP